MNNQNSTCCNAPVMVSSSDEGTACYVCRHCMKATDVVEQNSKCGCTHAKVKVIFQGSQCNECFDGFHEKCINNTSPRLENWEEKVREILKGNLMSAATKSELIDFISTLLQEEREKLNEIITLIKIMTLGFDPKGKQMRKWQEDGARQMKEMILKMLSSLQQQ